MRRYSYVLMSGIFVMAFLVGIPVPGANAADPIDQTPPSLTIPIKPAFVVGNVVERSIDVVESVEYVHNIQQLIQWSATDNVGVWNYDVDVVWNGGPPYPIIEETQDTQFVYARTNYDGAVGGGSLMERGFLITARDHSYNATTKFTPDSVFVTQEDGEFQNGYTLGAVTYSGAWVTTFCECFLFGATRRSSMARAAVTFAHAYSQGDHVALVMAEGPREGAGPPSESTVSGWGRSTPSRA